MREDACVEIGEKERLEKIGRLLARVILRDGAGATLSECRAAEEGDPVAVIAAHGEISTRDLSQLLSISPSTARRVLTPHIRSGRVRQVGKGRSARYVLTSNKT